MHDIHLEESKNGFKKQQQRAWQHWNGPKAASALQGHQGLAAAQGARGSTHAMEGSHPCVAA